MSGAEGPHGVVYETPTVDALRGMMDRIAWQLAQLGVVLPADASEETRRAVHLGVDDLRGALRRTEAAAGLVRR